MVAELLYLEKQGQSLPIEMLINSSGTTRQDGEIVSVLKFCFVGSPSRTHARVDTASRTAACVGSGAIGLWIDYAMQSGAGLPVAQGCVWLSADNAFMCMPG